MAHIEIRLSAHTHDRLVSLARAFEGNYAIAPDLRARDDVLIARVLGWRLRQIDGNHYPFWRELFVERRRRETRATEAELFARENGIDRGLRDVAHARQHLFTRTGITKETKQAIVLIREVVSNAVQSLTDAEATGAPYAVEHTLLGFDDTTIIMLAIWVRLRRLEERAPVHESYPGYIVFEIEKRAEYREQHGLTASPRVPRQRSYGPLSALDRAQFRRNWRESIRDVDTWSDSAIAEAIMVGG